MYSPYINPDTKIRHNNDYVKHSIAIWNHNAACLDAYFSPLKEKYNSDLRFGSALFFIFIW